MAMEPKTFVYLGRREGRKMGEMYSGWALIDEARNNGSPLGDEKVLFFRDVSREQIFRKLGLRPGFVFVIDYDVDTGSIKFGSAHTQPIWKNEADRATWRTLDLAAEAEIQVARRMKDKSDEFRSSLDPFREAYREARGAQRRVILAMVMEYIMN